MNVDDLRTELRQPADVPLAVDVDEVVARGRRRRALRRSALPAAVAAVALVVGVPVVVVGLADGGAGMPAGLTGRGAEPTSAPWSSRPPTPGPGECPVLSGAELDTHPPCGAVIRTGEATQGGERVFWFSGLDRPGYLSLQEGRNAAGGSLMQLTSVRVSAATFSGVARLGTGAPGAGGLYGAVRGDVRRVVLSANGRPVEARVATWSVDRRLAVWWAGAPAPDLDVEPGVLATAYGPGGVVLSTVRLQGG
jgi:hypothetical protein